MGLLNDLIADEARLAQDVARLHSLINGLGGSIFETPDDAALLDLLPWEQVTILRPDADSPIAAATYQRVDAEPTHPEWFQDPAGRYYAVAPDNGRVRSAWFGTGIPSVRRAQAVAKRIVLTTGENYLLPTTGGTVITATDEDVEIIGDDSSIEMQTGCVAFMLSHGTFVSEHSVSVIDGKVFTLPDGVGILAKGDVVKMGDLLTPHWWNQGVARIGTFAGRAAGEHLTVGAATGTTLTLVGAPEWSSDRIPEYSREIMRTTIKAVTNSGGKYRVETDRPHFYKTGLNVTRENIGGTTGANGTGPITVIDSTHYDIDGSTYAGTYTSGGTSRLSCTYSTAAAAGMKVGKMRDSMFKVRLGKVLCAASVTSHTRIIKFSNKKGWDVKLPYVQKSAGMIVSPISCYGGKFEYYADGTGPGNSNYIATISGCTELVVKINGSGTTRHTIDGGSASSNDGTGNDLVGCGAAAYVNVFVDGGNVGSTEAAHATHAGTYRWNWHMPKGRQSTGNVVVRGIGHTVHGGRSAGAFVAGTEDDPDDTTIDAGGYVSFCQFYIGVTAAANNGSGGIRLTVDGRAGRGPNLAVGLRVFISSATGAAAASTNGLWYLSRVEQTVISGAARTLIDLEGSTFVSASGAENAVVDALMDAADDFTVMNTTVDDASGLIASNQGNGGKMTIVGGSWRCVGATNAVITAGRQLVVRDLNIEYLGAPNLRVIGIGAGAQEIDVNGMVIRAASTIPYIVDINSRLNPVRIIMRNLEVYNPNGAMTGFYRNLNGLPPAGSRFGNIWIYGTLTGPGLGITWEDFAPFIDGPIYVNGEKVADAPDA